MLSPGERGRRGNGKGGEEIRNASTKSSNSNSIAIIRDYKGRLTRDYMADQVEIILMDKIRNIFSKIRLKLNPWID